MIQIADTDQAAHRALWATSARIAAAQAKAFASEIAILAEQDASSRQCGAHPSPNEVGNDEMRLPCTFWTGFESHGDQAACANSPLWASFAREAAVKAMSSQTRAS